MTDSKQGVGTPPTQRRRTFKAGDRVDAAGYEAVVLAKHGHRYIIRYVAACHTPHLAGPKYLALPRALELLRGASDSERAPK